jgi:shikimate kinase
LTAVEPGTSRIILTGFSGSGKSAAAPVIAEKLGWRVADTDEIVERTAGKRILEIFSHQRKHDHCEQHIGG